ncbi:hypothetical protein [Embleya sp. NPDC059259]|uniref:hypothetical protein n=1 Tax=unclassified Embleya TaxID=2699296 RepID=UPI0036A32BE9
MALNDTLVVPVEVAAFAVNPQVRDTDDTYTMQRLPANFSTFASRNTPPELPAFSDPEPWRDRPERLGAYVTWQLPSGLARGRETEEGIGKFPLIPNRWLVTRRWDGGIRSWLVESDHLGDSGTVSYLDPHTDFATPTRIGRKHELTASAPWQEPEGRRKAFLTALGPGLLTFSVYQPYNTNVLSLHDSLEDVSADARVSYRVIGWYAQEEYDPLCGEGEFRDLMDELEWILPPGYGTPSRSLYAGSALGIDWKPNGPIPPSGNPRPDEVAVGIGNSTAEASAAVEEQYGGTGALNAGNAQLFKAFALGCLERLDRTDGDLFPERAAHRSGFGPVPGGYAWRVVDRGDPDALPARSTVEAARECLAEATVVADLNAKQRDLDAVERKLRSAQEYLFHLWSLSRLQFKPDFFTEEIADKLKPEVAGSPARQVADLTSQVLAQRTVLPWSMDQDELEAQAREHAASKGLRSTRVLQRVPLAPYEEAADPVVLLRGANLHAPLDRDSLLPCRTEERLVTAVGPITAPTVAPDVARVNTAGLPHLVSKLLAEFFILDRARAQDLDLAQAEGALPEYGTEPWEQPWQPLFLMWKADYVAIPFQEPDGTENWRFDGERYRWTGSGTLTHRVPASGRQILTPTSGHLLEGQLAAYANGRTDLDQDMVRSLRSRLRTTDELSQRLDGLSAQIGQRITGSGLRPDGLVGDLIADGDQGMPRPGTFPEEEWEDWEDSDFQELRSGQLEFTRLAVVDRFGRAVNLIDNPRHFDYARPTTFIPDEQVGGIEPDRYAQLGPRLLQPARLAFHFLDGHTGQEVDVTAGANPVCAWLLHNRLDRSIACYSPDGTALGDIRIIVDGTGRRAVEWNPLPGSPVPELEDLADLSRHAHDFLAGVRRQGPAGFDALRRCLDDTLAVIDPDGPDDTSLACFFGRPLALVRAELGLELCGPVRKDVHWKTIFDQPEPRLKNYLWRVRLGEAAQLDDGLIGYVHGDDYDHFETTVEPGESGDGYLRWIDRGERMKLSLDGPRAQVTLLLDARAAVHATTEILPVGEVFVPQEFTEEAVAAMTVAFRAGPLLAPVQSGTSGPDTVLAPHPATATGTWTWTERDGETWPRSPMAAPDPTVWPQGTRPRIRSGFMLLDGAADASRDGEG